METEVGRAVRFDALPMDATYYTEEGYLIDCPVVTTCGIFEYKQKDGTVRRELRRPEDVFDPDSLASYKGKPVFFTHSAGLVDSSNANKTSIGTIMSEGRRDGQNVVCDIVIHDTSILERFKARELSLGYTQEFVPEPGEWEGQAYDGYQTHIVINHLAIVANARAGDSARLNIDSADEQIAEGGNPMSEPINTNAMDEAVPAVEGQVAAPVAEASGSAEGANAPDAIQSIRDRVAALGEGTPETAALVQDLKDLLTAFDQLRAQVDFDATGGEEPDPEDGIQTPEEQNLDAEPIPGAAPEAEAPTEPAAGEPGGSEVSVQVTMDDVNSVITERLKLFKVGQKLNLDGLEDMSIAEAKGKVVAAVNPGMRLDGKSEDYLDAAYDMAYAKAMHTKSTDIQRQQMNQRLDSAEPAPDAPTKGAPAARDRMIARNQGRKE